MKRRIVSAVTLMLLLTSMVMLAFHVQPVGAAGTIYIRADGSIDPLTAPILTSDNITYTLTDDITTDSHGIWLERNNMMLDGVGFTVRGTDVGVGISLLGRSNVTVTNITVNNFEFGIQLDTSNHDNIIANNIANNSYGITLWGSFPFCLNNNITANNITANNEGIDLSHASNNSITGNNITSFDCGILVTFSSNHNEFSRNNIADNGKGIWLSESSDNRIFHNNFVNNTEQVHFEQSGYANVWDDGYPSGGDYWSDYVGVDVKSGPNQNLPGSDGIGDTPYVIDRYPLVYPWSPIRAIGVGFSFVDPFHFNITVRNFGETAVDISKITVALINGTVLEIPYYGIIPALPYRLSLNQTVTLNCTWDWTNYQGENATIKVFTSEDYPAEVTLTLPGVIPEFPSFLILPLFMIAALLAVIVCRRRRREGI